jgi:DNA repair exonuclease SbcCD nuclease subunit
VLLNPGEGFSLSKVLIFSDLHLHNWPYGATIENGMNSRLKVQADFLDYIAEYSAENEIDYVIFCGDLVHTHGRLDIEVMDVALDKLPKIAGSVKQRCIAIRGNHDMKSLNMDIGRLFKNSSWEYHDKPVISIGQLFNFFPYSEDNFISQLASNHFNGGNRFNIVFMHQGVKGVPMGSGFEIPDEDFTPEHAENQPNVLFFTGHYHKHQQVRDNLTVIGSPMQHTWGDMGDDRGFIILDTDTSGKPKWKFRPYNAPKFVEIKAGEETKDLVDGNYVRVILSKTISEIENYREDLKKLGAKSVEFRVLARDSKLQKVIIPNLNVLEKIIERYEKQINLDENTIKMGRAIRQGTYAPGKIESN